MLARRFLILGSLILGTLYTGLTAAMAQDHPLNGSWTGSFMIGPEDEREIIFHLSHNGTSYTGTLDYPAMGSAGVLIDRVSINGDSISLLVHAMQAEYYGSIQWADPAKSRIVQVVGDWSQAGEYVPVTLTRKQ